MSMPDYSRIARPYALARPGYPPALYARLAALAPGHALAWDCATGSGQAAVDVARHFERVVATDVSPEQIREARAHPRVRYRVASAEASGLDDASVDLITVASALHWFDLERFYAEARRVLRPGGVLAAWTYHVGHVEPPLDRILGPLYTDVLAPHFAPGARLVDRRYADLRLPGAPLEVEPMHVSARWSLDQLRTFVESWSGARRFLEQTGTDAFGLVEHELRALWGRPDAVREIRWPLYVRVARIGGPRPARPGAGLGQTVARE